MSHHHWQKWSEPQYLCQNCLNTSLLQVKWHRVLVMRELETDLVGLDWGHVEGRPGYKNIQYIWRFLLDQAKDLAGSHSNSPGTSRITQDTTRYNKHTIRYYKIHKTRYWKHFTVMPMHLAFYTLAPTNKDTSLRLGFNLGHFIKLMWPIFKTWSLQGNYLSTVLATN